MIYTGRDAEQIMETDTIRTDKDKMQYRRILITGATGYVGGRLVPLLLQRGYQVRCMAREPRRLMGRWESDTQRADQLEIVFGDVMQPESLVEALRDVDVAYYLIHAMGDGEVGFVEREKQGALAFAHAAERANISRIIYLGGLGRRDERTSAHLHSRHNTGTLLRTGRVPVTEFRAAMIVGSGSASFEMLRHLTEKLPAMICPRWINTRTQPIFIVDVLNYLVASLQCPDTAGRVLDIGGPDILTYREMMQIYADVQHLRRLIITVPVLTPRLSSYWVNLVTPIPASIAAPLIEGLRSETICENDEAHKLLPIPLTPFREAVVRALNATNDLRVPTRWTGAVQGAIPRRLDTMREENQLPADGKGLIRDIQQVRTTADLNALRRAVARVGGKVGWYYANWLWDIRGSMDRLIGGVGVRRGRRHPEQIVIGDPIDFWRVEDYTPDRLLLRAEMKVPGRAWLEFRLHKADEQTQVLTQTAYYLPGSIWGYLYWFALLPIHYFVFSNMARNMVRWAEQNRS